MYIILYFSSLAYSLKNHLKMIPVSSLQPKGVLKGFCQWGICFS